MFDAGDVASCSFTPRVVSGTRCTQTCSTGSFPGRVLSFPQVNVPHVERFFFCLPATWTTGSGKPSREEVRGLPPWEGMTSRLQPPPRALTRHAGACTSYSTLDFQPPELDPPAIKVQCQRPRPVSFAKEMKRRGVVGNRKERARLELHFVHLHC